MVAIKDFDMMPSCCNNCGHWSFNRDDEPLCDLTYEYIKQFDKRQDDCPLTEAYTKADIVDILEDLKKEMNPIKECEYQIYQIYGEDHWNFVGKCQDAIQQKIDALKGEQA